MASRLDFSQIRSLYVGTSSSTQVDTNNLIVVGNVGIGTTAPTAGYKLDVVGSILSQVASGNTSIVVSTNNANGAINAIAGSGLEIATDSTNQNISFRTGASSRMYIKSDGNVGINTTSPQALLHVQGTGLMTTFRNGSAGADEYSQLEFVAGSRTAYIWLGNQNTTSWAGAGGLNIYTANGNMDFWTSNAQRVRIDTSGNLGIGTMNPQGPLEVYRANTGGLGGHIILNNNGFAVGNETAILFNDSGVGSTSFVRAAISSTVEGSPYFGDIKFKTGLSTYGSLSTRMIITGAGNVGIGTTTPGATLTVGTQSSGTSGSGVAQDNSIIARFGASNTASRVTGATIANTATATVGNDATLSFIVAGNYSATGLISAILQNTSIASTDMAFSVYDGGMYERMRITAGGNVGIGTTAPGNKLAILAPDTTGVPTLGTNQGHFGIFNGNLGGSYGLLAGIINNGNAYLQVQRIDGTATAYNMLLQPSGGNVGIGTTAPISKVQSQIGANGSALLLVNAAGGGGAYVDLDFNTYSPYESGYANPGASIRVIDDGAYSGHITFRTKGAAIGAAQSERMRIEASTGNVGIGTTAPGYKLDVRGSFGTSPGIYISGSTYGMLGVNKEINNASAGIQYYNVGSQKWFSGIYENTDDFGFYSVATGSFPMVIQYATGNVGIGTTGPVQKLHVVGKGLISNAGITGTPSWANNSFEIQSSSGQTVALEFHRAGYTSSQIWSDGNNLIFGNNSGTERMRIQDGNVGIGTTGPNRTLSVNGTIGTNYIRDYNNTRGGDDGHGGIDFSNNGIGYQYAAKIFTFRSNSGSEFYGLTNDYGAGTPGAELSIISRLNVSGYGSIGFYTNVSTTPKMWISPDGNVGIGTMTPDAKLVVTGDGSGTAKIGPAGFGGNYTGISLNGTLNTVSYNFLSSTSDNHLYINRPTGNDIYFRLANNDQVAIKSSGNVGIGTTAPAEKLSVVGNIRSAGNVIASVGLGYGNYISMRHDDVNGYITITRTVYAGNLILEPYANVGISTTNPSYKLDVSGTIRATGDVIAYSDARVKENVETLDGALDKVMKMRGVSYNKIGEQEKKVGVIAQEILEVLPEVVSQDETGTYSVAYGNIVSVLIEAIKEQQKQIDELKAKLK